MSDEKVDAWMPLWIGSYLADTMALSRDSHGGYLLLLFAYWRTKGPLQDDDEDLAGITKATPAEWKKLRPRLAKFFVIEDGLWRHKRADEELARAGILKAAAVSKARAGAEARWGKHRKQSPGNAPSMPEALPKQCPTPPPSPVVGEPIGSPPTASGGDCFGEYIPPEGFDATLPGIRYGEVAGAIRRAGLAALDPGYPLFRALVDAGATAPEFLAFVDEALTKDQPFKWLIGAVSGERKRAAQLAGQIHRGPMPIRASAAEQRVLDAVPGIAAAHLRPAAPQRPETFDVPARLVD